MNRRHFLAGAASVSSVFGAVKWNEEMQQGDIAIQLVSGAVTGFFVGVRSSIQADWARVQVFYKETVNINGTIREFLRAQESLAPVAGEFGYGGTKDNFTMPRNSVDSVRVTLMRDVGPPVEFRSK